MANVYREDPQPAYGRSYICAHEYFNLDFQAVVLLFTTSMCCFAMKVENSVFIWANLLDNARG